MPTNTISGYPLELLQSSYDSSVSTIPDREHALDECKVGLLNDQDGALGADSQIVVPRSDDQNSDSSWFRSVQQQVRRSIRSVQTRLHTRLPTGWKFGALLSIFQGSIVLLINIIILIWSAVKAGGGAVGIAFQGSCNTVGRYSIGIHLVINVLSTLLLGASNYVMQTLCAPTRPEVDRAHEKGIWVDIGLQSTRNLKYTSPIKRILWIALSSSSIPLHLFYNSSFFSTISAEKYSIIIANGPDLRTMTPDADGRYNWTCGYNGCPNQVSQEQLSQWDVLSNAECIQAYATDFVSDRATVVPVVGDYISNGTLIALEDDSYGTSDVKDPFRWICFDASIYYGDQPLGCNSIWRSIDPSKWTYPLVTLQANYSHAEVQFKINYCLSQPVVPKCQLNFNVPLLVLVIMFNIVKVACMVFAATKIKDNGLVTIGDAIASFTSDPDMHTRDMCLASSEVFNGWEIGKTVRLEYQPRRIQWLKAANKRHWIMTMSLFTVTISTIIGLLVFGLMSLGSAIGFSTIWQLGIGNPHAQTIITGWNIPPGGYSALVASVLVSNSPQLILSIIYFIFNSLCTKMFLAREWFSYAHTRKALRVSTPQGEQRSTYFLQIPYRFGLPLMAYSTLLHWLVSQSIFLVQVTYHTDEFASENDSTISSCGYSPLGMLLTLIVSATLILGAFLIGFFAHFNGDMPFVGSCSAAISASCHPPPNGSSDPLRPMKWGAVLFNAEELDAAKRDVGHVCFSSGEVFDPIPGCYYL